MSSNEITVEDRLRHMTDAIDRASDYLGELTVVGLQNDRRTYDAILRNLIVIGEASRHVPVTLRYHYQGYDWRILGDTRNRIVHDYSRVDHDVVWNIAKVHLPVLRSALDGMVRELDGSQPPAPQ